MARSSTSGRLLAIISPLTILPMLLLALCAPAAAQVPVLSYGFQGDGIFPKLGTANSTYWIRGVYDDNNNDTLTNGEPDPILRWRLERRDGSIFSPYSSVNLLPFLHERGDAYESGILPSPSATALTGQGGFFTTTGDRAPALDTFVASTVDPAINYTGSPIQFSNLPWSGTSATTTGYASYLQSDTTSDDGNGYGPLVATANATDAVTIECTDLPAGDWTASRVRITWSSSTGLVGQTRDVATYTAGSDLTVTVAFSGNVPSGSVFVFVGPYTTTSDGTNRILQCAGLPLPGVAGQWVGGSVRITASSVGALVNLSRQIATYDPATGRIITTTTFPQAVPTGTEFQLDGFLVVDDGLGDPTFGETWLGAQLTIPSLPLSVRDRNVVAWEPNTGTLRVETPYPTRITVDTAYEIFLAIFTVSPAYTAVVPSGESFYIPTAGLGVPRWYIGGSTFDSSGYSAQGKIVWDVEDDANRDGDVLDPGDNLPGTFNAPDIYVFMDVVSSDNVRFSLGPWTRAHGCTGLG